MAFKYCRAYGWPYAEDRKLLAEAFYKKAASNVRELQLPCNAAVFLAYENEEYPAVSIALDMDAGVLVDSTTSRIIDDFIEMLGEPKPQSLENPGWLESVDENYNLALAENGVTFCEGVLLQGKSQEIEEPSIYREWKSLHEECLVEAGENSPDADHLTKFNYAIGKSTNIIREKYGLSKERMLSIIQNGTSNSDAGVSNNEGADDNQGKKQKKWWQFWKDKAPEEDSNNEHKIKFIKKRVEGSYTYYDFEADSEEPAIGYLRNKIIDKDFVYYQVYTPDSLIGKDRVGMFKQERQGNSWGEVQPIEEFDRERKRNERKHNETSRTKNYSGKIKKCINCGDELSEGVLRCPSCGSDRFIWE